ncbi:MAG: MBL fold metallo-hydrolase, partial [Chloroflexota bacterium]
MAATDLGGKGLTTTITCYGGVNEIGGNKILLEDGERRLFFDFGKAFGRHSDYFDGVFIKDRTGRGLLDPISLGLIPPLRGLLRDDLVPVLDPDQLATKETPPSGKQKKPRIEVSATQEVVDAFWDRWRTEFRGSYRDLRRAHAAAVDLILLSHAHQDHISDLEFVSSTIAAASTRTTAFISKVLLDTSQESSGAAYVSERRLTKGGLLESAQDSPYIGRPWHFLDGDIAGAPSADPLDSAAAFWAAAPTT